MLKIMADNDVLGHVRMLVQLCESAPWDEFWREAACEFCTFADLGLAENATDAQIWWSCQENEVVLITGNRNAESPQSLEVTLRQRALSDAEEPAGSRPPLAIESAMVG